MHDNFNKRCGLLTRKTEKQSILFVDLSCWGATVIMERAKYNVV
jgi:hypothetical protein